jgi:hypothetical protein
LNLAKVDEIDREFLELFLSQVKLLHHQEFFPWLEDFQKVLINPTAHSIAQNSTETIPSTILEVKVVDLFLKVFEMVPNIEPIEQP